MICAGVKRYFFTLILIFLTSSFTSFAQNLIPEGLTLSDKCTQILEQNGFTPTVKELSSTGNNQFHYNIYLTFFRTKIPASSDNQDLQKNILAILIPQEDFWQHSSSYLKLFTEAQKTSKDYILEIVLTVPDNLQYNFSFRNYALTGTHCWAKELDTPEYTAAILANISKEKISTSRLYTSGLKKSSPMWLTKLVTESFKRNNINCHVVQKMLSLYRAGMILGDSQLIPLFGQDISCIRINFADDSCLPVLSTLIKNYNLNETSSQDIHYSFLQIPHLNNIWLSERTNIIFLDVFGILVILLLSTFSFVGKKQNLYKKALKKSWFMLPILIIISLLSLYAGQLFCGIFNFIKTNHPVIQLGIKFFISIIFVSILFIIHENFNGKAIDFIYGWILLVVAIINVFVFSFADISLFWIFALEFLLIYLSRTREQIYALIISMVLMAVPFLPAIVIVSVYATNQDLLKLVYSSPGINILFTLVLFPFQIMWLRILIKLDFKSRKNISLVNILKYVGTSSGIIVSILIITVFAIIQLINAKNSTTGILPEFQIIPKENISLTVLSQDFESLSTKTVNISSKKPAFRYIVSVTSDTGTPVLDSTWDFISQDNSKTAIFSVPDYPPEDITIEFGSEQQTKLLLTVQAIYKTENPEIFQQETLSKEIN